MRQIDLDRWHMARAIELARLGQGHVEPNPQVGCLIARDAEVIGEGWHQRFGGPHAEIEALQVAGPRSQGSTIYVTLEPCSHQGKTPPCADALIAAGVGRVVVAHPDPFPAVSGQGLARLRKAGISCEIGILESEARELNAPYLKLLSTGRPWMMAKWAMTLDGKLATRTGASRWISSEASRAVVHQLRGRVDAILIGIGTALTDDPLLTPRPAGPRVPLRIVLDRQARLPLSSQLVRTAREAPVLVVTEATAPSMACAALEKAGCEVFVASGANAIDRLDALLLELGRRRMTNVLVEGGGQVFASLFESQLIDEAHIFVAPKIVGGASAITPVGGLGFAEMSEAWKLQNPVTRLLGDDLYIRGRVGPPSQATTSGDE